MIDVILCQVQQPEYGYLWKILTSVIGGLVLYQFKMQYDARKALNEKVESHEVKNQLLKQEFDLYKEFSNKENKKFEELLQKIDDDLGKLVGKVGELEIKIVKLAK